MPELELKELEERQTRVEATLEQIEKRLTNVEGILRDLSSKIDTNFRWTIGIIISMWVTTMLAVITTIFTILLKG